MALRLQGSTAFSRRELHDVEDWLDGFDRISHYKRWVTQTLNSGSFFFSGVARTCFVNPRGEFRDWTIVCARFRYVFEKATSRVAEAQQKLPFRTQQPGKPYIALIEDGTRLYKCVDLRMTHAGKDKHITKDLERTSQSLMVRSPSSLQ